MPLAEKAVERGGGPCPRLSAEWPGVRTAHRIETSSGPKAVCSPGWRLT